MNKQIETGRLEDRRASVNLGRRTVLKLTGLAVTDRDSKRPRCSRDFRSEGRRTATVRSCGRPLPP